MKKYLIFVFFFFSFLLPFKVEGEELTERVIVIFNNQVETSIVDQYAVEVHHIFQDLSAVSMTIHSSEKPALLREKEIARVEPDSTIQISEQKVGWGYHKIQANRSKESGWTGKGIKIGIVDTGIHTNHPDLKVAGGISFVKGEPSYEDEEGHGTHVAGIIAAQDNTIGTLGIAPDAEIYAIKALDRLGDGNQSDIVAAIEWAITKELDIVNLSISAPNGSYLLNEAIRKAYNAGIILVAASGNSLQSNTTIQDVLYPARYPEVIAVGAIGEKHQLASFSYFGQSLDFVAPGEKIYSTYNGMIDGVFHDYAYMNGTSMAAPYVAGIAALYKQAYPQLNNKAIREMMQRNALDLGEVGKDIYYGYGLVQAPGTALTGAAVFPDIAANAWYKKEIDYLVEKQIITGYEDGKFYPGHFVSRAEAITMIGKALSMVGEQQETRFTDVPNSHYASGYIQNGVATGVIKGFPDLTFKPNATIIRGDVAVMLQKAFTFDSTPENVFADVMKNKYYYPAVNALKAEKITTGYPDATYKPESPISRAEFSVLLARALDESFK